MWLHYSQETDATFYSQWGRIGGCWSTWASSASPLQKGGLLRALKRSEIEQKRLMSHKLCLLQTMLLLHRYCSCPAAVRWDRWTSYCCYACAYRPEVQTLQQSQPAAPTAHPSTPVELLAKKSERFSTSTCELRSMHANKLLTLEDCVLW